MGTLNGTKGRYEGSLTLDVDLIKTSLQTINDFGR
jgi:hypothetical protein